MSTTSSALDVALIRKDFPILSAESPGEPLAYLDSAATSLKPQPVIDAICNVYRCCTANVGRGIHRLSNEATEQFENAREEIASFIEAEPTEIAFVRNATEAANLVSRSLPGSSRVLATQAEHHSNLLPWRKHHPTTHCSVHTDGRVDLDDLQRRVAEERPAVVAVSHISNALGSVNPVAEIVEVAHRNGAQVFLDASQSVPHCPFDVGSIGCDYACFSGHKMLGPSGIGVLFARKPVMEELEPLNIGGGTVEGVDEAGFEWRRAPWRLEAGTPFIEGAIGLAAACNYLDDIGRASIDRHVNDLVGYALSRFSDIPYVQIRGPQKAEQRGAAVSWTMDRFDVHTVARILSDRHNICIRSGYHCAEPVHRFLAIGPTLRASFYLYNSRQEVDRLADALQSLSDFRDG